MTGGAAWVVLGAGSILPRAGYGCAGYALLPEAGGPATLFDCGPGTLRALGAAGIELERVRRVVLSHFHPDHCLDLFALAFARRNPDFAPAPPLELVGPRGLARVLAGGEAAFGRWVRFEDTDVVEVEVEAARRTLDREGLALAWTATGHTRDSLAWRATLADGVSVTFTGDTGENPAVARLAEETDLFVAECSFRDAAKAPHHLSPRGAARLARAARARRLLLTHFYPEVDPDEAAREAAEVYPGPIEVARDGSVHGLRNGPAPEVPSPGPTG